MANKISFPRIIAFLREDGANLPEDAFGQFKASLKIREADSKVILAYAASDRELCRLVGRCVGDRVEARAFETGSEIEMIEACDSLVFLGETRQHKKLLAYAEALGRHLCSVSPDGRIHGLHGLGEMNLHSSDDWLPSVFKAADLSSDADLETIFRQTDALATTAAPVTERYFKWIIMSQALAVVIPITWLINRYIGLPTGGVAGLTLCTILMLVILTWWLRWRGMQKTWARARLVAEVARSMLATSRCPGLQIRLNAQGIASLRHLRWFCLRPAAFTHHEDWVERYIKDRIDDHETYLARKQASAEAERRRLSRWATLFLDISLVFAVAGVVIYLGSRAREFTHMPGGTAIPIVLALAGVICPLILLLIELQRALTEDRRNARYAQQTRVLKEAKHRLAVVPPEKAAAIVEETERQLLSEVFEWYFQVETAQHFFLFLHTSADASGIKLDPKVHRHPFIGKLSEFLGHAGLFTVQVVLGRVIWTVVAGMVVLAWISYQHPPNPNSKSDIQKYGDLQNADGKKWIPSEDRLENGCVIIVHGLRDGIETYKGDPSTHWTRRMAKAIQSRMSQNPPEIAIFDWNIAATPTEATQLSSGIDAIDKGMDYAEIRPQAHEVGEALGFRLAEMLNDGIIDKDKPLHLIGHSAGGFVVSTVACVLNKLKIKPTQFRVTLLDTPLPDSEITVELGRDFPGSVDYYHTSALAWFEQKTQFPGIELIHVQHPPGMSPIQAHKWAHDWYIDTIRQGGTDGFSKSPLNNIGKREGANRLNFVPPKKNAGAENNLFPSASPETG
jgi:hypothetical protein